MIEPQNTMMPLPAKSATADVPNGEAGFGEMLAQTLGMISQVDPNAIAKIMGDTRGTSQGGPGDDEALLDMGSNQSGPMNNGAVSVARYVALPSDGLDVVPNEGPPALPAVETADSPAVEAPATEPKFDTAGPAPVTTAPRETSGTPQPPAVQPATPHPVTPQPTPVPPRDGIWHPVPNEQITAAEPVAVSEIPVVAEPVRGDASAPRLDPDFGENAPRNSGLIPMESTPVEPAPRREPAPIAPITPTDSAPGVDPVADPAPMIAEAVRNVAPEQLVRGSATPAEGRTLPTDPTPLSDLQNMDTAPPPMAAPRPTQNAPSIDLGAASPVRMQEAEVRVAAPVTVPIADAHVAIEPAAVAPPTGLPIVDAVQPQTAPVVDGGGPALPLQNTALAERVLQAVEMQANQPPPRTMVVDIPEIEGLRLVVSVRSGAEVHVVPSTSSAASDGLQSFMDELQGVLTSRGFVMTGDGRRRGSNPHNDERPEPQRPQRPTFRRPQPTDNDLRI